MPPMLTGFGLAVRVTARSAVGGLTWVTTVALLLAGLKSGSRLPTVAVEEIVPTTVGLATTVMVAVAPTLRSPRLAPTNPAELVTEPWVDEPDWKMTLVGRVWLMVTPRAVSGPLLMTVTV